MDGIEKMSCEYQVVFYQRSNGSEPAREFIDSLSPKMTAKMIRTIELLQVYGPDLREPYSKKLVMESLSCESELVMILLGCCIFSIMIET